MSIFKHTGIGRHMDWRLLSNRLSFVLPPLAGAFSLGWDYLVNDNLAFSEAGRAAIAVFLAWAIAREIDPDREWVAYAAMPIALAIAIGHSPNLIVAAVALVGLRTLVGTVGRKLTVVDHAVLVVGASLASSDPVGWPVAAVVVVAILVSDAPGAIWWTVLAAIASTVVAFEFSEKIASTQESALGGYLPFVFIVLAGLTVRVGYTMSVTDSGERPLDRNRLRSGRVGAALVVAFASYVAGPMGMALVGPVLAAVLPAAVAPASERS